MQAHDEQEEEFHVKEEFADVILKDYRVSEEESTEK